VGLMLLYTVIRKQVVTYIKGRTIQQGFVVGSSVVPLPLPLKFHQRIAIFQWLLETGTTKQSS